jgi:hypothetical protein
MRQVRRGFSIRLRVTHRAGRALAAPDAYTVDVLDHAKALVVDGTAMEEEATGIYYYDYTPATTVVCGVYQADYKCTTGSFVAGPPETEKFEVVEELD